MSRPAKLTGRPDRVRVSRIGTGGPMSDPAKLTRRPDRVSGSNSSRVDPMIARENQEAAHA